MDRTISSKASKLLTYFNEKDKSFFYLDDTREIFPDTSINSIKVLLGKLVKKGILLRLYSGLYNIIPFEKNPKDYFPNWHLTASKLAKDKNYYIGYYSALELHGLITQPALIEQVVVDKQMRPGERNICGVAFNFIYHNHKHFFGFENIWIDDFNKVQCSDLEKTIIDSLYKTNYAGGIVEISKAIYKVKDELNIEKLEKYCISFGEQSVIKRLGFLLDEIIGFKNTEIFSSLVITNKIILLDYSLPSNGEINRKWKIEINMDIETIRSSFVN